MFGLSFWEIAIILAIALIVLGPKKLPELARSLGKGLKEFRKATEDFKSTMDAELRADDNHKRLPPPGHTEARKSEEAIEKQVAAEVRREGEVEAEAEFSEPGERSEEFSKPGERSERSERSEELVAEVEKAQAAKNEG